VVNQRITLLRTPDTTDICWGTKLDAALLLTEGTSEAESGNTVALKYTPLHLDVPHGRLELLGTSSLADRSKCFSGGIRDHLLV